MDPTYGESSSLEAAWETTRKSCKDSVRSVGMLDLPGGRLERWRQRFPAARFEKMRLSAGAGLPAVALDLDHPLYDLAILGDGLARLYDPWDFLLQLRPRLASGGRVAALLPNVRNIVLLHQLAEGEFSYPQGGIQSEHLRFYTRVAALALFEQTGYALERLTFVRDPRCAALGLPAEGTCNVGTAKLIVRDTNPQNRAELTAQSFLVLARSAG